MKIIVAIIVYNRFKNIERWAACWKQCNTKNAELVIIHNCDLPAEIIKYKTYCKANKIKYISRPNQGFDIGAFQDVCKERLQGFPEYDYLLWCTDDTFPMSKDFMTPFIDKFKKPDIGISCMQISSSVSFHVRTTGFCIRKETSLKIIFPADPIVTKGHCYLFEHRGGDKTFTNQIRQMGLSCEAVATNDISPLWDSGYWKRLDRMAEHNRIFNMEYTRGDKVTFICTIFNTYPQIISSLILQTHKNWELILIHDGPTDNHGIREQARQDSRIKYIETKERVGNWGHALRQWALNEFDLGDYTMITNADNYYVPVFIEYMLKGFKSHTAVATYCDTMTHSYKAWEVIPCKLERGYLDAGGVLVKSNIAKEIGWQNTLEHSADWLYFSEIAAKYSWSNFIPVKGNLFVHN